MADICLLYAPPDRAHADLVLQGLRTAGLSVWSPSDLGLAQFSNLDLGYAERDQAKLMLVLWTHFSVESSSVRTEADAAARQGRLISVLIDVPRPPLGFTLLEPVDLHGWQGDANDVRWQKLVARVRRELNPTATAPPISDYFAPLVADTDPAGYPVFDPAHAPRVFIAHTTEDKPRIRPFVEIMLRSGLPLWIDKPHRLGLSPDLEKMLLSDRITYGSDWREGIRKAIRSTDLVLGFWSEAARAQDREQFHYELYQGLCQNKLHLCRIDDISFLEIGTPYTFLHIADLSDFRADLIHPELRILMQDFAQLSGPKRGR